MDAMLGQTDDDRGPKPIGMQQQDCLVLMGSDWGINLLPILLQVHTGVHAGMGLAKSDHTKDGWQM